jgi:hypothetical protein
MELSHEEKDRVVAEEKFRFETVKSLQTQGGGKICGHHACASGLHGCCHCGAFWKGLILGLVLCVVVGCFFHQRNYRNDGERCYYDSPMMQYQDSPDTNKR